MSIKNYSYEVSIDSSLLNENLNFSHFFNNNKTFDTGKTDQHQSIDAKQVADCSIRYFKDKSDVDQIINAFMDKYKEKLHVTCITTANSMVVRLSP